MTGTSSERSRQNPATGSQKDSNEVDRPQWESQIVEKTVVYEVCSEVIAIYPCFTPLE
jgi:hypothetical protein